jgi:hypothetical protein
MSPAGVNPIVGHHHCCQHLGNFRHFAVQFGSFGIRKEEEKSGRRAGLFLQDGKMMKRTGFGAAVGGGFDVESTLKGKNWGNQKCKNGW